MTEESMFLCDFPVDGSAFRECDDCWLCYLRQVDNKTTDDSLNN